MCLSWSGSWILSLTVLTFDIFPVMRTHKTQIHTHTHTCPIDISVSSKYVDMNLPSVSFQF